MSPTILLYQEFYLLFPLFGVDFAEEGMGWRWLDVGESEIREKLRKLGKLYSVFLYEYFKGC